MSDASLTIAFTVDRTPEQAFAAITSVRGWWSGGIDGDTDVLGAEFTYRYQDIHRSTPKITELVPGRKVTWHVVDGYLGFTACSACWSCSWTAQRPVSLNWIVRGAGGIGLGRWAGPGCGPGDVGPDAVEHALEPELE
jgi:hypothetical protein